MTKRLIKKKIDLTFDRTFDPIYNASAHLRIKINMFRHNCICTVCIQGNPLYLQRMMKPAFIFITFISPGKLNQLNIQTCSLAEQITASEK